MFMRTVDILEGQTKDFWQLSNKVRGRIKDKITVEKAIEAVNNLEFNLGSQRVLFKHVKSLGDVIIQGKVKKAKKPATISVLQFATSTGGTNA